MKSLKKKRIYSVPGLLPNILTILSLSAGMSSLRFSLAGNYQWAVLAIALAAIFDNLDGRIARYVGQSSALGAELDSLADIVSFGVAPCVLMYLWTLQTIGNLGWMVILIYMICGLLRLARFNVQHSCLKELPSIFFIGVPIPAAAGLIMFPILISFAFNIDLSPYAYYTAAIFILTSWGMVSQIHTFSFKRLRIPPKFVLPLMVMIGVFASFIATAPWFTLIAIDVLFVGTIPLSIKESKKIEAKHLLHAKNKQ